MSMSSLADCWCPKSQFPAALTETRLGVPHHLRKPRLILLSYRSNSIALSTCMSIASNTERCHDSAVQAKVLLRMRRR